MMRRSLVRVLGVALIAAVGLCGSRTASAQQGWTIDQFHADIAVQHDLAVRSGTSRLDAGCA
ncbi:MAG: hypothetical protein ACYDEB_02355 [Dehalococcoidia bacterium]